MRLEEEYQRSAHECGSRLLLRETVPLAIRGHVQRKVLLISSNSGQLADQGCVRPEPMPLEFVEGHLLSSSHEYYDSRNFRGGPNDIRR
jgi:hypothetical protein